MIAVDAIYNAKCLTALYNKASRIQLGGDFGNTEKKFHGIALAKLAASIEEAYDNSENEIQLFSRPIWSKCTRLVKMHS